MISLEDAQTRLIGFARRLPAETLPIGACANRWLVEEVIALRTQPVRDLSAMDGYAVVAGPSREWTVIGESAAGRPFDRPCGSGEAVRIFTGAALPTGADAVIIQEDVERSGDRITLTGGEAAERHRHVRPTGSDFRQGELLVEAGCPLTPAHIALAATGGHGSLSVARRPRVAIMATGDELVSPGIDPGDDKLPESNATMVSAMLGSLGVEVRHLGIIPDDLDQIVAAINRAEADLLVTLGGASVGDRDLVRPALEQCGATMDFWKVAMRPGKPVMAGQLGEMQVIGLPGNPVSAFVTTLLFVMPFLRAMLGSPTPLALRETARLTTPLPANGPRTDHIRAVLDDSGVAPTGRNDSAALAALAASNALIVRAPNVEAARAGEIVHVIRL
jgi:molybdopterin molybdotransferase